MQDQHHIARRFLLIKFLKPESHYLIGRGVHLQRLKYIRGPDESNFFDTFTFEGADGQAQDIDVENLSSVRPDDISEDRLLDVLAPGATYQFFALCDSQRPAFDVGDRLNQAPINTGLTIAELPADIAPILGKKQYREFASEIGTLEHRRLPGNAVAQVGNARSGFVLGPARYALVKWVIPTEEVAAAAVKRPRQDPRGKREEASRGDAP